jgi:hypothetical protein
VQVTPVGMDEPKKPGVVVYPNPSSGVVWFSGISNGCSEAGISLYNATGQCVAKQQCQVINGSISLLVNNLPNGTYFAKINACHTNQTVQLVVQSRKP